MKMRTSYTHYRSLAKEGPLWIVRPSPSFALISCLGLKPIRKNTHLLQALQIGISHCLASLRKWWDWFTHTTRCKLHCCTVVYTSTGILAHDVMHYLHCFEHLVVHNVDNSNVGPPPSLSQDKVNRPWALFHKTTVSSSPWCLTCSDSFLGLPLHLLSAVDEAVPIPLISSPQKTTSLMHFSQQWHFSQLC